MRNEELQLILAEGEGYKIEFNSSKFITFSFGNGRQVHGHEQSRAAGRASFLV